MTDTATNTTADTTATPDTTTTNASLESKVLKQVEYYFSDSNYPNDKFLKTEAAKNTDGYILIDVIASFNRMKTLTTDLQFISDTLKKSSKLQISEDGKMVRRTDPVPDAGNHENTLYSKGWPDNTTIEMVESFFEPFGKVLSVRLRKRLNKSFKGSLHVDFESEESVKKVIEAAPKLEDKELIYQTFADFANEKKEQQKQFITSKQNKRKSSGGDLKDEVEKEDKEEKEDEEEEAAAEEEEKEEIVPGTIVSFTGCGTGLHRGDIKQIFAEYGDVLFVGFNTNDTSGSVRYKTAESAKKAMETLTTDKKEFAGQVPTYSILEGEEEKKAWEKVFEMKRNSKNKPAGGKGGRGGRGGRGGKGFRGGRGGKGGNKKFKKN
eukprot:gene6115-7620_t